jgi:hypothetical protein
MNMGVGVWYRLTHREKYKKSERKMTGEGYLDDKEEVKTC